jgi:predicted MFS family arabinose efflux permease
VPGSEREPTGPDDSAPVARAELRRTHRRGGGLQGSIALMLPGLLLVGAGMGLCITPLNAIALANVEPRSAGSASGIMSTVQQVGNALGTALSGVIFFGALDGGTPTRSSSASRSSCSSAWWSRP